MSCAKLRVSSDLPGCYLIFVYLQDLFSFGGIVVDMFILVGLARKIRLSRFGFGHYVNSTAHFEPP